MNNMMMKNSTIVLLTLLISITTAFAQENNQWMVGWIGGIDFNNGTFQYYSYPDTLGIRQTTCGISDTNGQIKIWSNGSEIFRNDRSIIGSVPHLPFSHSFVQAGLGLNIYQGAIVIPDPGNIDQYYLFYASQEYVSNAFQPVNLNTHLYYSKINMNANGGLGAITANGIHVEDSLYLGNMIAIKHANARDWWLIAHKIKSDQYITWLITPSGVSSTNYQAIGFNIWAQEYIGSLASSEQGDKIATMIADGGPQIIKRLEVMNFDRCSGMLSNVNFATYQDSGIYYPRAQFSPNARYVYSTSTYFLYQFDTQAGNLQNSKVLIDVYDSTYAPFEANFQLLERAPDGKIYCHSSNGNWSLHVINSPDSSGINCNFVQNQFNSGVWYCAISGLPNLPNYELGVLPGSPCDTLTGNHELSKPEISVFPNPFHDKIEIRSTIVSSNMEFLLFDLTSRLILSSTIKQNSTLKIPAEGLTQGMYIYQILNSHQIIETGKIIAN